MRQATASICGIAVFLLHILVLPASADEARVEVPITQTMVGKTPRYSIPIAIGGGPVFQAMLDTGSFGLRVLPRAVPDTDQVADTGQPSQYGYGSGVRITGTVGEATVQIGSAATAEPIPFQRIRNVGCLPKQPRCAAMHATGDQFGFGGNGRPGEGFAAIVGANFGPRNQPGGIENPLYSIGTGNWIIRLPGETGSPGVLIINPNAQDLEGFTMFSLAEGQQSRIPGCLSGGPANVQFCGSVVLDTGAPGVRVTAETYGEHGVWRRGASGRLTLGDPGEDGLSMDFTANPASPEYRVGVQQASGPTIIKAGVLPFSEFAVYYDGEDHALGLKRLD